jgi:hypothetical protein
MHSTNLITAALFLAVTVPTANAQLEGLECLTIYATCILQPAKDILACATGGERGETECAPAVTCEGLDVSSMDASVASCNDRNVQVNARNIPYCCESIRENSPG